MLTVENSPDWLGREASSPRQLCRDDCVNVKLFVKLFVITRAARRRPGRERRCRDGLRSHLGSDQTGSRGRGDNHPSLVLSSPGSFTVSKLQAASPLARVAPGKDVVFMHRLLCFLPIVSLFWRNSILCFTMTLPQL